MFGSINVSAVGPKNVHRQEIEPNAARWQAGILPLNHQCLMFENLSTLTAWL